MKIRKKKEIIVKKTSNSSNEKLIVAISNENINEKWKKKYDKWEWKYHKYHPINRKMSQNNRNILWLWNNNKQHENEKKSTVK